MALVLSPSSEQGYIRTAMSREHFMDLGSSTLALPSEEMLKVGREDQEKSRRIQHQVQMTMARKTNRKSLANGSIHQSVSISEAPYTSLSPREGPRSPSKNFDSMRNYQSSVYENGWSGGYSHSQYSQQRQENGWARGHSTYSQRGTEQAVNQSKPLARREVSPEREVGMGVYEQRKSTAASLRYPENRQYSASTVHYARSEFGANAKTRQSRKSNMSDQDSVFMYNVASSPARAIYEQRNSRSLNNLLDKENYQTSQMAGSSQVRAVIPQQIPQQMYSRPEVQRATYQKTVYRTGREDYSAASGMNMGNKRATMTAGRVAVGNGIVQSHVDGVHVEAPAGNSAQVMSEVDMTLERAVSLLKSDSSSSYWLVAAASFIQHECFQKIEARKRVYTLGGIPRLIRLLNNDNEEVQRASCAALRNLVFEDNDNKLEVCEQRGMPILLNLLRDTQDLEIKRQITGLLWNLSSNDQLKVMLIRDALSTLTKSIIIPCSGWKEGEYSKNDMMNDADIFYNATGCLRNMSSAGPEGRQAMRECDGLTDSLVHYVRKSIADYKPDDRATENCVCILHNLSYQLESELPGRYSKYFSTQNRNTASADTNVGCFGGRSRKVKEQWGDAPAAEEISNPRGVEWLWNSIVVRMYLSLIAKSSRNYTQEASLGSLQNLTAGNGSMPFSVAQMVVQKENGLQHVRNMLFASDPGVKRTAVSLLRNLSRNPSLHNDIATELMPDLVRVLPDTVPETNVANDSAASLCYVINSLISGGSQNAKLLLQNGGVRKLINLSSSDGNMGSKAGKAASLVLYNMWSHQELHNAYKKANFKKGDFVNPKTSKAYHSL